jgi:sialic acid synthase SpsE
MSGSPRPQWSGGPVYAIAEIGLNHGGSLPQALRMVDAAAQAGVTAIKLQSIVADRLVAASARLGHVGAASLVDFFRGLELDWDAHRAVIARARERRLQAVTTPFAVDVVPTLDAMEFDAFKIASGDLTYHALVEAVAATGRPLILSSGMSTLADVVDAVARARAAGARDIAVLHCVSAYPTPAADENLRAIVTLREACGVPVGLSDHGRGLPSAIAAVALGATLYERHLVLADDAGAIDRAVSSTPDEMAAIVAAMEDTRIALGDGAKVCRPAERPNRAASRRGLYAARDLTPGERLTPADLVALRPLASLAASDAPQVLGHVVSRRIAAGEPLGLADVAGGAA